MTTRPQNGFVDPVVETMSQPVRSQLPLPPARTQQELLDALAQRKLAQDTMHLKGSYGPRYVSLSVINTHLWVLLPTDSVSLTAMKHTLATPETAAEVQARLDALTTRRCNERQALFDLQADTYLADALDLYLTRDDGVTLPELDVRLLSPLILFMKRV
jgi:hypothetical protein